MISTERFLEILGEKDLLPGALLESLRRQVRHSAKPIPVTAIAKTLVDKGHLGPALVKRLLAEGEEPSGKPAEKAAAKPAETPPVDEEDELGLAPLEEDQPKLLNLPVKKTPAKEAPKPKPEATKTAAKSATAAKTQAAKAQAAKPQAAKTEAAKTQPATPAAGTEQLRSLVDEELAPLGAPAGSPLDGLMAAASLDASAGAGLLGPPVRKKRGLAKLFSREKKSVEKQSRWDSPLLLIGGGAVLLMLIAGGAMLFSISRQSGDELLKKGNEEYKAGSYAQAIHQYDAFLEKYSARSGASTARVFRGLAQLQQATQEGANWASALELARKTLGAIATESDFKDGYGDLASMLTKTAEGLAKAARAAPEPKLVAQTREALALLDKYVPKSLQPTVRLTEIEASLALSERSIARGKALDETVAKMQAAAQKNKPQEAYDLRNALLKQFADLADNAKLQEAVLAVSQALRAAVKVVEKEQAAETSEPAQSAVPALVLARRAAKEAPPGAEGQVVFAAGGEAVYGIEAAGGKVLWRRPVGFAANVESVPFPPTPVSPAPGADVLLVDPAHGELQRVEALTGRLRWRQRLDKEDGLDIHPVLTPDRVLVATKAGRLVMIDLESGRQTGYVDLPQRLAVAPAVDSRASLIFQMADQTNLFVLSLADSRCKEVVYLGHEPGSVTVPPVVAAGQCVVVAVNDGAHNSTLQALMVQPDAGPKKPIVKPVQQVRLQGRVDMPPVVSGRRVLVATDRGTVAVFEIGSDAKAPLHDVAQGVLPGEENVVRFPLLQSGVFWLADVAFTKYEVQAARKRVIAKWIVDQRSVFLQPPVGVEQAAFTVRRRQSLPGVLVSAVGLEEPTRFWETELATPLATEPLVADDGKIIAVTAGGALYRLDPTAIGSQAINDQPLAAMESGEIRQPLTGVLAMPKGLLVLASGAGADQVTLFDPAADKRFRTRRLPGPAACTPIVFAGGLLVPSTIGQVFLVDPVSGQQRVEPFQPRLESGATLAWGPPADTGDNQVVLTDGHAKLYALGVKDAPKPHLAALAEADLTDKLVSPLAALGKLVYGVDAAGTLTAFELPKLKPGKQWPLGGRVVWGPRRLGQCVLLATDDGQLGAYDANQKRLWQVPLPFGPLAGTPLESDGGYLLASKSGVVWRIDAASGKQLGKVETGRPLGTGPVALGNDLLLGGHDGTLYQIKKP